MPEVREDDERLVRRGMRYEADAEFVGGAFETEGYHCEQDRKREEEVIAVWELLG
jgi:hypothetical protein